MQELAIDLVVQEDAKALVGSSRGARGASSSSTPCFPQAGEEGGTGMALRAGAGDLGRKGSGRAPHGIPKLGESSVGGRCEGLCSEGVACGGQFAEVY